MDLDFSEEQQMLREMVRALCGEHSTIDLVRSMENDPRGYTEEFWKKLAEVDLLGLLIPEEFSGSGMDMLDAALVYHEFGRSLAPSPHFVSCVLAALLLLEAGSDEQKREWLPSIARGDAILSPAWLEPENGYGPRGVQVRAIEDQGNFVLSGTKLHCLYARSCTRLLVLARTGEDDAAIDLFLVDPEAPGVTLEQQLSLASDTQYRVTFDGVRVAFQDRLGSPGSGWGHWNKVMHQGIILAAAQAVGGAERALEITCEYATDREQFGKPLAGFQSISHYLADAATLITGGTTLVHQAAWASSENKEVERLAPMAKLFACQAYRDITAMSLQVFGGVGFTVEYDAQLFFRRAKQLQLSWWDGAYLEELVAATILD
jgi:alkylation response protein AidB-like acyl-CoA dehydrogenase